MRERIKNLPEQAGVYQFFDKHGEILYIGKAKNLKKRVSSYFNKSKFESFKAQILVKQISDIKYIVVDSESDALLLENTLIKKHQPRYNILLKDDKTFPWICIRKEDFPRVYSTRNRSNDGSEYFGPFTSAFAVKVLLQLIRKLYPLRTCSYLLSEENIKASKYKLCLEYHLGNCKGPCVGLQGLEDYEDSIKQIRNIVKGNLDEVIAFLREEMAERARQFQFEEAQSFKDKIEILERYQAKSTIVSNRIHDVDVFSIVSDEERAYVNYLKVIKGAVIQAHSVEIKKKLNEADEDILAFAMNDIREKTKSSSREVIIPFDLEPYFPDLKLIVPQRGDKKKLLDLSRRNALSYQLDQKKKLRQSRAEKSQERILLKAQKDLHLKVLPRHIECFDNSNIQGSHPVAACVVFKNAKASKKDYRHFHIKSVQGANDFASMQEVIYRRYKRLLDEKQDLPQLVVIDGGKGQLNAALQSLERLNIRGKIAIIGIAKRLEEIYFPGDNVPLYLDKNSETLKLIQHLRNEAHRFGIAFHRKKRTQHMTRSEMENLPGIGSKTLEKLFSHFTSLDQIKAARKEEIAKVIGSSRAAILHQHFHGGK